MFWLDRDDPALGPTSRERIRTAWEHGSIAVCAISFGEVAMLTARGRIDLWQAPESWWLDGLRAGWVEIALESVLAAAAPALLAVHAGPADRFIVATALARGATVAVADQGDVGAKGGSGLPARL